MGSEWLYLALFVSLTLGHSSAHIDPVSEFREMKETDDDMNIQHQLEIRVGKKMEPDPGTILAEPFWDLYPYPEPDPDTIVVDFSNADDVDTNFNSVPIRKSQVKTQMDEYPPTPPPSPKAIRFVVDSAGNCRRLNEGEGVYDNLVINQLALAVQWLTKAINGNGHSKTSSISPADYEEHNKPN